MTQEEKVQAYDEAIERARKLKENPKAIFFEEENIHVSDYIFPELRESEDERIRKAIHIYLDWLDGRKDCAPRGEYSIRDMIAWLEKQGKCKSLDDVAKEVVKDKDAAISFLKSTGIMNENGELADEYKIEQDEQKPNWCHHKVDLSNCSEEYRKAYYDGWNNCNMQHSQCELDKSDVLKCLINGMKFYYEDNEEATWGTEKFSMKVKDILSWLEKQGDKDKLIKELGEYKAKYTQEVLSSWLEKQGSKPQGKSAMEAIKEEKVDNANKVKPKFKVGDKIRRKTPFSFDKDMQVARIDKDYYICNHIGKFSSEVVPFSEQSSYELIEQKPSDKVEEPKFNVGDFIVNNNSGGVYQVTEIRDDEYCLCPLDGKIMGYLRVIDVDNEYHLWTIADAKDGDVLVTHSCVVFIFKNIMECGTIGFHAALATPTFASNAKIYIPKDNEQLGDQEVFPATKKQRDLLFKKMKKEGYEWDAEKRELKNVEQNYAWSEEDESNLQGIIDEIEANKNAAPDYDLATYDRFLSWLKFLKDRVQPQPKQEWSEEDEERLKSCLNILQAKGIMGVTDTINTKWLKSLKDRYTWKPSDKQIASITCAVRKMKESTCYDSELVSLYQDLKKLKLYDK